MAEAAQTPELNKKTYQDPVITKDGDIVISRDISTNRFPLKLAVDTLYRIKIPLMETVLDSLHNIKMRCLEGYLDISQDRSYLKFPNPDNLSLYDHNNAIMRANQIQLENTLSLIKSNKKQLGKLYLSRHDNIWHNKDYPFSFIGTNILSRYDIHIMDNNSILTYKPDLNKNQKIAVYPQIKLPKEKTSTLDTTNHYYFIKIDTKIDTWGNNDGTINYRISGGNVRINSHYLNTLIILKNGSNYMRSYSYIPNNCHSIISSTRLGIHANNSFIDYIKTQCYKACIQYNPTLPDISCIEFLNNNYLLRLSLTFNEVTFDVILGNINIDDNVPNNQIIIGYDCFKDGLNYHFIHTDKNTYFRHAAISISKEDIIPFTIHVNKTGTEIEATPVNGNDTSRVRTIYAPKAFMGTTKYGITFCGDKTPEITKSPEDLIAAAQSKTSELLSAITLATEDKNDFPLEVFSQLSSRETLPQFSKEDEMETRL